MLQQHIRTETLPPPLMSRAGGETQKPIGFFGAGAATPGAMGSRISVKAGQAIFNDGEAASYCYKVLSGGARIVKLLDDGRREICEFATQGDYLGLEAGEIYASSAEAVADSVLLRYRRSDIDAVLQSNAASAFKVCRILARAVETSRKRAAYLCRMSADEKVACFLLDLADRNHDDDDDLVSLPMSRSDIADHLGLATETVSRVFTRLRAKNVIALEGSRGVRLLDREFLEDAHTGI